MEAPTNNTEPTDGTVSPKTSVEWVSVSSKLPDAETLVLIALNDDDVWTGFCDSNGWRYVDAMPIKAERVTHWAHMPKAPESEYAV